MQNIILDEEFMLYLPALGKDAYEKLEQTLLAHGARDSLVLWNDILIDGYNRFKICTEHNIPFTTVSMEFDDREDVRDWIIWNQLGRRNLTPLETSHYRGVLFNSTKRKRGSNNQYPGKNSRLQSAGVKTSSLTAREIGERFKVSKDTIERDGRVAIALDAIAEVSLEAKRKVLSGEIAVDRSKLQRLSRASKEEIEAVANQINDGTYNRKDHRVSRVPEPSQEPSSGKADSDTPWLPPQIDTVNKDEANYVDTIVSLITGNLNTTLKSLNNESGIPELKTSLRAFITSLEELYTNLE